MFRAHKESSESAEKVLYVGEKVSYVEIKFHMPDRKFGAWGKKQFHMLAQRKIREWPVSYEGGNNLHKIRLV